MPKSFHARRTGALGDRYARCTYARPYTGYTLPYYRSRISTVVEYRGKAVRSSLRHGLELEIWDEPHLLRLLQDRFGVRIDRITSNDLISVRRGIDGANWRHAFGDAHADDDLADTLLWHYGFWTLRGLHQEQGMKPQDVLAPGLYQGVAILMADLCSFSSYLRDTRDEELTRHCLTAFYSRARYAIHNAGSMLYQFVGDEVIGLFGLPHNSPGYTGRAIGCARALIDVGDSVSSKWQRELDREQGSRGVHIGIAVGALNLMPPRPFSAFCRTDASTGYAKISAVFTTKVYVGPVAQFRFDTTSSYRK